MENFLKILSPEEITLSFFLKKKRVKIIFRIRNLFDSDMFPVFLVVLLLVPKLAQSSTNKWKLCNNFVAQGQPGAWCKGLGNNVVILYSWHNKGVQWSFDHLTFTVWPQAKLNTNLKEISKEIHEAKSMAGWLLVKRTHI